jgi:hypothetical protein
MITPMQWPTIDFIKIVVICYKIFIDLVEDKFCEFLAFIIKLVLYSTQDSNKEYNSKNCA